MAYSWMNSYTDSADFVKTTLLLYTIYYKLLFMWYLCIFSVVPQRHYHLSLCIVLFFQGSAKLEKAEILQMTVDHLKMLHTAGGKGTSH